VSAAALEVNDVSISFDGIRVLDHLSLALMPGELRFLIGPNGAGKTTLIDVISGKTRPNAGGVTLMVMTRCVCVRINWRVAGWAANSRHRPSSPA
jgi:ABC-type uncharacterized transport system ATPase subunit